MTTHKHELTTHKDHITGGDGADVFNAPIVNGSSSLSSQDVLDGGAGNDKVVASLFDGTIDAVMNNIETGVFATDEAGNVGLDLAHAGQMTNLIFRQNGPDIADTKLHVTHAERVKSIAIEDASDNAYTLSGVDPQTVTSMQISADKSAENTLDLIGTTNAHYDHIDVSLANGSFVGLLGSAVAATTVSVESSGNAENGIYFTTNQASVRHLIVSGSKGISLNNMANTYMQLQSFDATAMHGHVSTTIGGHDLHLVRGGDGVDDIGIETIGGSSKSHAIVSLGKGDDYLSLDFVFDAKTQHYDGGAGHDLLGVDGRASDLAAGIKNFEALEIWDAKGSYDLADTGIKTIEVHASSVIGFSHLEDGSKMTIDLEGSANIGNAKTGFAAAGVSDLEISFFDQSHDMYLAKVGSKSDAAHVTISGSFRLSMHESSGAANYIQTMTVADDAGVDLSGLSQAFAATGATISGGNGDDVLVGGDGADQITTGDGNNTVVGSIGADVVNLLSGSGSDLLVFHGQSESAYGLGHDTVNGFGAFDGIDLSALGDVSFAGDVSDLTDGLSTLSSSHASAFFNTQDHTLYVDLDHDKQLNSTGDMAIQLNGVDTFSVGSLIG